MSSPNQDEENNSPTTFKEAFGILQRHAESLRRQQEPNIDELVNIVTESVRAYKVCKARIEAVEQALERTLGEAEADRSISAASGTSEMRETSTEPEASHPPQAEPGSDQSGEQFDDDIPF